MKKSVCVILMLALVLSLSVPAFAQSQTTELAFTYPTPEPSFTVSIPGELVLEIGQNLMTIGVICGDLEGKQVIITAEETNEPNTYQSDGSFFTRLVRKDGGADFVRYFLRDEEGWGAISHTATLTDTFYSGAELFKFSEAGKEYLDFYIFPMNQSSSSLNNAVVGVDYVGYLIFGIKLS